MQISSVQEYRDFVARHKLPLSKMRFALERKYEPRWFYLYHDDQSDEWIVAKNKDDGTTFIRYQGPSEAEACQILFDKMEQEARNRGYLGGYSSSKTSSSSGAGLSDQARNFIIGAATVVFIVVVGTFVGLHTLSEGYYVKRASGEVVYYMDGEDYAYDAALGTWYLIDDLDDLTYDTYDDYYDYYDQSDFETYYGDEYFDSNSDWAFSDTSYYDDYHSESSDSDWDSDDYSSWDSSDTDWGSDW